MNKIAIGIPTLNESDSIAGVVEKIDKGLTDNFENYDCTIVNIDSESSDGTVDVFLNTVTRSKKKSIVSNDAIKGKGVNIFNFIDYAIKDGADFMATFDGDLTSIESNWVLKMLDPIVTGQADYVTPLYTRNRYEGNTTNHYCVPFVKYFYGVDIKQPIGGEFAFSNKFARIVEDQVKPGGAYQYGIDIFLTTTALKHNLTVAEVCLGKKKHKPSFGKMVPMFKQIADTTMDIVGLVGVNKKCSSKIVVDQDTAVIDTVSIMPDKKSINERMNIAKVLFNESRRVGSDNILGLVTDDIVSRDYFLDNEYWNVLILNYFKYIEGNWGSFNKEKMVDFITSLYLFRVLSYFKLIEGSDLDRVEQEISYTF